MNLSAHDLPIVIRPKSQRATLQELALVSTPLVQTQVRPTCDRWNTDWHWGI